MYRKLRRLPIPPGATAEKRRGVAGVRWTDGRGREQWAKTEGGRIVQRDERWTIQYTDADGKVREAGSRTTDEKTANEIAASLQIKVARQRRGLQDSIEDRTAGFEREAIAVHLVGRAGLPGYREWLTDRKNSRPYIARTVAAITRTLAAAKVGTIAGFDSASILRAIRATKKANGQPISGATVNAYIRAVKGFSRWLYERKRAREDGLRDLELVNAAADRTFFRREITPPELAKIMRQAEIDDGRIFTWTFPGGERRSFHARGRVWAYRIAAGTGFRENEIANLTRASFDLDASPPTITAQAAYTKTRRRDVQPIAKALADQLRPWLATTPRKGPLFKGASRWGFALRADAVAAGVAVKTARGSIDFHALRHTYASQIAAVTDTKTGQSLTRHASVQLYLSTYAKERDASRAAAVEAIGTV